MAVLHKIVVEILKKRPVDSAVGIDIPIPTAYYPFEGNGNDSAASPQNMSIAGTPSYLTGLFGTGILWSTPSIQTPGNIKFNPSGGIFTLAFWFKSNVAGTTATLTNWTGAFPRIVVQNSGDILNFTYQVDSKTAYQAIQTITSPANLWNLVLARYNGSTVFVSLNGGTEATQTVPAMTLGSNPSITLQRTGGNTIVFDNLTVWKGTCLTPTHIATLYNSRNGRNFNGSIWV